MLQLLVQNFGIKLKTSSFELNRIYFKRDSPRYNWWLRTESTQNREKGLCRTNFEQLTPNIAERVVHSNCKQKWLTEFSLSVKSIGKTIFSDDSTSCMDFFILDFFLQIQGVRWTANLQNLGVRGGKLGVSDSRTPLSF